MNNFLIICTSVTFFSTANGQTIQYATRFRNFSIESETDSAYLVNLNIYQDKHDHKFSSAVNITKDIYIKNIEVIIHRCSFEKSDCENFQRWVFTHNLRSIIYMKNQIWTPIIEHITPKLNIPFLKKNVYKSNEVSVDAKDAVNFYPEVVNYFWRVDAILNDHNDEKALVIKFEAAFISFVKRHKAGTRRGSRTMETV